MGRRPERFAIYSGDFASQTLVFAHLLDCRDRVGDVLRLDFVQVIARATASKRLGAHFDRETAQRIEAGSIGDTIVLIGSEAVDRMPLFRDTGHLTFFGVVDGWITRAETEPD